MTDQSYYYDRAGKPITSHEYLALHEAALDSSEAWERQRRVARSVLDDGTVVSTVWTGLNTNITRIGPPAIFETMVFGGPYNHASWRYSTESEAVSGHEKIVRRLMNGEAL